MRRRAFTLFEVLVALALIVLLLGAIMGFLGQLQFDRGAIGREARRLQAVGTLYERLEVELLAVVAGDSVIGPGLKGDARSLSLLSLTTAPSELESGLVKGGIGRTTYTFDQATGTLSAERADPLRPGEGGTSTKGDLGDGLSRVQIRYFATGPSGIGAWRESFDSVVEGRLPLAVEIAVWFSGEPAGTASVEADQESTVPATLSPLPPPDRVRMIAISGLGGATGGGGGAP